MNLQFSLINNSFFNKDECKYIYILCIYIYILCIYISILCIYILTIYLINSKNYQKGLCINFIISFIII